MKIITLRNKLSLHIYAYITMIFWLSDFYSFFIKSFLKLKLVRFLNKRNIKNLRNICWKFFFQNRPQKKIFCFFQLPPNAAILHIRNSLVNLLRTHIYIINSKVLDLYKNAFRLKITTVLSINKNFLKWFFLSLRIGKAIK